MLPTLPGHHRPEQLTGHRRSEPLVVVMLAFAASLAACGVAGLVAWQRCGTGNDCSAELAISILGLAPAALLVSIMLLLIGAQLHQGPTYRVILALAVGVSVLPLTAFTMGDVVRSAIASVLVTALAFSVLSRHAERREPAATAPDEITLIEQTRALRIRRHPRPAPVGTFTPEAETAAPVQPSLDIQTVERLRALLERASDLDDRAVTLSLRFSREAVHIDQTPSGDDDPSAGRESRSDHPAT